MEILNQLLDRANDLIPTGIAVVLVVLVIWLVRAVLNRRYSGVSGRQFRLQFVILILSFAGLLVILLTLPIQDSTKGQLIGLIGILLSAAIALSATTFVGNIMAGLMLRVVKNFRTGDFVRVGETFGRVSDRGLFHIEIQTEDRDLTTLPNLYLVTNPVKVIRASGTLVSAEVSLGYDTSQKEIESALLGAAEAAGLEEPFVHIVDLGDFAVTYRLSGLLTEVKSLLTTRSRLRSQMLDFLHDAGIEIVSPTFMNQRAFAPDRHFVPSKRFTPDPPEEPVDLPEAIVFDKADEAESLENLRDKQAQIQKQIEEVRGCMSEEKSEIRRSQLEERVTALESHLSRLTEYIERRESTSK